MKDNMDNLKKMASSLHDFEAEPPVDLWDRIEAKMRRRKRLMILSYTSIAATILILLGIGISLLVVSDSIPYGTKNKGLASIQGKSSSSKNVTDQNQDQLLQDSIKKNESSNSSSVIKRAEYSLADGNSIKSKANLLDKHIINPIIDSTNGDLSGITSAIAERSLVPSRTNFDSMAIASSQDTRSSRLDRLQDSMMQVRAQGMVIDSLALAEMLKNLTTSPDVPTQENRGWALALGYGSGGSINISSGKDLLYENSNNYSLEKLSSSLADETSYFREISNVKHNPPVSIGATISYPFSRKWSLETGVIYTRLSYTLDTYIQNSSNRKYTIALNYIGIPIGLRFQLLDTKRFGMYLVESMILEKGMSSKAINDVYTNNALVISYSESYQIKGIQLSSFTGLGIEARTFNKLYLYGQGGVQAFFLNKTQPFNIRSEHVAWPSFQVGLRFRLK